MAKMVKALVSECKKRSTAGSRMPSLLGQADVEELWNHSMWNKGGGEFSDDGGSFGESDEVSDANVHTFDSDFDEPEGEDEDEDEGGGEEEVMTNLQVKINDGWCQYARSRVMMQKRKNAAKRKKAIW